MSKKPTLKSEIARLEGIFTQNILDLSRRIDGLKTEALENDQDVNNLHTRQAMDHQAVVNLVEQVKELQKARGYGTTMEEMVNKISAENPSVEAQRTIKRQAEEIEQLRAGWNNEVSVLRNEIGTLQKRCQHALADAQGFKEMEATWKRVAEERLREIDQLRADDTDLREDLELHRNTIANLQRMKEALIEKNNLLAVELLAVELREAKSRAVPYNPFRPGCE
jgi:chromosome segregation ATPase